MPSADTLLADACESKVACLHERGLLIVIAETLAEDLGKTADELMADACASGIACLDERDLWIVAAQSVAGETACVITTELLPNATDGTPYDETVTADAPATFAIILGALPDGLSMDATGHITGTPILGGSFNFVVEATTADGTCTAPLEINVLPNEGFVPPQLANLFLWLAPEALDELNDNDPILVWPDASGNGNDANPGGGPILWRTNQLNGIGGVQFDGSNDAFTVGAGPSGTVYTIFAVFKFNAAGGQNAIIQVGGVNSSYTLWKNADNRGIVILSPGATFQVDAASTANAELWSAVKDAVPLTRFFVNGVNQAITNSGAALAALDNLITIGNVNGIAYISGFVFELLVYNIDLSDADRQTVETHLLTKYAL